MVAVAEAGPPLVVLTMYSPSNDDFVDAICGCG
jgi:hypothetical protein